jgi:hypothetical protein
MRTLFDNILYISLMIAITAVSLYDILYISGQITI